LHGELFMEISEQLWKDLKENTLEGAKKLLDSADKLLSNDGNVAICAGLYSYAVEEYGKFLILDKYRIRKNKVNIQKILFKGRDSHDFKLEAAFRELPDECKYIGIRYWGNYFPKNFFLKGYFPDESSVHADFKSRMAIFYSGLDDSWKAIKPIPLVSKNNLKVAVDKLKTYCVQCKNPKI
jgi:AbiV family abortive infection protein